MSGEIGLRVSFDMANIFAVGIGEEASDEVSNTNRNNLAVAKPKISVYRVYVELVERVSSAVGRETGRDEPSALATKRVLVCEALATIAPAGWTRRHDDEGKRCASASFGGKRWVGYRVSGEVL